MVMNPDPANGASQGRGRPVAADLVASARNGDKQAWDALVERFAPLIWSICRRHGLGDADTEDVGQNVWLKLVDQLGTLRVPAALPGWLATTTRRECGRILRAAPRAHETGHMGDTQAIPDDHAQTAEKELLAAERHAALREALTHLPPCCQQLIALAGSGDRSDPVSDSRAWAIYFDRSRIGHASPAHCEGPGAMLSASCLCW
jgi:RNA polymerase sigma factor (sigma-70 family)